MQTVEHGSPRYIPAILLRFNTGTTTEAELPAEWTVEEATREISRALGLPAVDMENRPQHYELFVQRRNGVSEKLNGTAVIGEVVQEGDQVKPMPEVTPGAPRSL